MQIFFLPQWLMVTLLIIGWPLIQVPISMIFNYIPDRKFDPESWWYRSYKWEKDGKIYDEILNIKGWKKHLPDGAKMFRKGFPKGTIISNEEEYLQSFIAETCRSEVSHLLQIIPFWVFGLFAPPIVIAVMFVYAIILNLPCIIAQRYNRPRLKHMLKLIQKREKRKVKGDIYGENRIS